MLGLLALILSMLALARPEVRTLTVQSVQGWLFTRLQISEAEDEQHQVVLYCVGFKVYVPVVPTVTVWIKVSTPPMTE